KEIRRVLLELVRFSVNWGARVVCGTEPTPAGEPPGVGALSPGSQDLLQVFSTTTLLKERQLFEEKLEKLTALQSQYFQTSLKQQQQIAESLALIQLTTSRAAESRLKVALKILQTRLRQLLWPFSRRQP